MNLKEKVFDCCKNLVEERIALAQKLIAEAQSAANQDSKSSMGDKYETTREMMALEMRKASEQLQEASKLKKVLTDIRLNQLHTRVSIGSLVSTSIGNFFVSVSLGKITIDNQEVFALSAVSPLGKKLMDKQQGDIFEFNSQQVEMFSVA